MEAAENLHNAPTVLLVDDDTDVLEGLEAVLEIEADEYRLLTASSTARALEHLERTRADLAFIDIRIGGDSGLDLLKAIKEKYPDTVCVMMTAYRDAELAAEAVHRGADDYLHKPLDLEKFLALTHEYIQQQQEAREKAESDRRFRAVFEQGHLLLMVLDSEGRVLESNLALQAFLGVSHPDINGVFLPEIKALAREDGVAASLKSMLAEVVKANIYSQEIYFLSGKGERRCFSVTLKAIRSPLGELESLVFVALDISDKVEREKLLARFNERLQEEVARRTIALEQARDQAEKASRAKTEFLSRMSHELRTPMNAVLGFSQMLARNKEGNLTGQQLSYLEQINVSGAHLLELIGKVLDLNTVEAGKEGFSIEVVDAGEVIDESISLLTPQAEKASVKLESQVRHFQVKADRTQLRQILMNYIDNAIKYLEGPGEVVISSEHMAFGRSRIRVTDNGPGIPEDMQEAVFRAFERLPEHQDHIEGAGVGLYLCARLAEEMNGQAGLDSKPGEGASFWVQLPAG